MTKTRPTRYIGVGRRRKAKPAPITAMTPSGPIHVPAAVTLRKYGLDTRAWLAILETQGWACAICRKVPPSGRLVTDHHHVPRWKKLKPERRRLHVRGLTCWTCNHYYLGRGINEAKAQNVLAYLKAYAMRMEMRP